MQPKACVSQRVEAIGWRVRSGLKLSRIIVTINGRTYRTLKGGTRFLKVSLVGLPKETVIVKITGLGVSGRRYTHTFTFHTCVRTARGEASGGGVPYFQ